MARLLLVGTGLIGGSFALAARRAGVFTHVAGVDVDATTRAEALRLGIVDAASAKLPKQLAADAVCIATHPSAVQDVLKEVVQSGIDASTPVFDVASVKGGVLAAITAELGGVPVNFVPCHPMAGGERRGPAAASADLFAGSRVFITPGPDTLPAAVAAVRKWWLACGAHVTTTTPDEHDARVALTSHLPHLLAFVYARTIADSSDASLSEYTGAGFRDFSRIAASDPALWRDIVERNADEIENGLAFAVEHAQRFLAMIRDARFEELEKELIIARSARLRFEKDRDG
jgi:prephenate dehydrogenase